MGEGAREPGLELGHLESLGATRFRNRALVILLFRYLKSLGLPCGLQGGTLGDLSPLDLARGPGFRFQPCCQHAVCSWACLSPCLSFFTFNNILYLDIYRILAHELYVSVMD